LNKEQAVERGYSWKDQETKQYAITLANSQIPDHVKYISDNIVGEVIECAHKGECNEQCTKAFKVNAQELQFYKKMNVALPRLCPNCRHHQRVKQRNPLKLWHRKCMKPGCDNEFETPYAPERPEIVYCETCYNAEVA
jgi:capsule polysaccharide modification protein KpsS